MPPYLTNHLVQLACGCQEMASQECCALQGCGMGNGFGGRGVCSEHGGAEGIQYWTILLYRTYLDRTLPTQRLFLLPLTP